MFDLLLKGAHLEDPINDVSGIRDIAIAEGKVAPYRKTSLPPRPEPSCTSTALLPYPESSTSMCTSAGISAIRADSVCWLGRAYARP